MTYPVSPAAPGRHHVPLSPWGDQSPYNRQWPPPPEPYPGPGASPEPRWTYPREPQVEHLPPVSAQPAAPPRYQPRPQRPVYEPPEPLVEEAGPDEPVWVRVRNDVAFLLRTINLKHLTEAFDRLGKRNALGPHGVVLLYADRASSRVLSVLRMFPDGPEVEDLASVLYELNRVAANNIARASGKKRRWDPRGPADSMVNGGDMDMPRDAVYIGAGVTSLDSEHGRWADVIRAVLNHSPGSGGTVWDIPGRGLALLTDGSQIRVVRDLRRSTYDNGISCNRNIDPMLTQTWRRPVDLIEQTQDPQVRAAWIELQQLNATLHQYLNGERN